MLYSLLKKLRSLSTLVKEKPVSVLKKRATDQTNESASEDDMDEETGEEVLATESAEGKRALTYQIFKNKGTVPYRKKEFRNPRVKHRMKYRKRSSVVKDRFVDFIRAMSCDSIRQG